MVMCHTPAGMHMVSVYSFQGSESLIFLFRDLYGSEGRIFNLGSFLYGPWFLGAWDYLGHRPTLEYNKGRYLCCHHSEGQMPTVSMLEPPEWPQHAPIVSVQKRAGCCKGQLSTRMIPITKPLLILHHHLSHEKYHICYSTGWLVNSPSSYAATSQLA